MSHALALESLRPRLPDFWWSQVARIQELIAEDAEAATFEATFLEHAAEALAQAEDDLLAHQHAPALWAASHQLKLLAMMQRGARGASRSGRDKRAARGVIAQGRRSSRALSPRETHA